MSVVLLSAALALTASACVGTEIGNPQTDDSDVEVDIFGYDGEAPPQMRPQRLVLPGGGAVTEAWLTFDEVRLRSCEEDESRIEIEDPIVVELVSGTVSPSITSFTLPPDTLCRVEFRLDVPDAELDGDVPDEVRGTSVFVRGERADATPFVVRGTFSEEFRLDGEFTLDEGQQALALAFAVDTWFGADELDGATVEDDETILIDEAHNPAILGDFRERLEKSASVFRDGEKLL